MNKTASQGQYRAVGEVPQDEQEYHLAEGRDFESLDEAKKVADAFVAQDPVGFTATVYNDEGREVYSAGTL